MPDFENWDNEPLARGVHSTPPHVERILQAADRRRERRGLMFAAAIVLIGVAVTICVLLRL